MPHWLRVEGRTLIVGDERIDLDSIRRIAVVGGGKAAADMAAAIETILGPELMAEKKLAGWVNVSANFLNTTGPTSRRLAAADTPACDDRMVCDNVGPTCRRPLNIHLHPARPPGVNEPTPESAAGTEEILRLVESLGPDDLCLCLISGGGSALLPAPVEEITLADKLAVTRHLSAAGANIEQLNTVRKQLSRIKGGGLMRACRAGRLVSLIISDVLGDRLDLIASGPTVPDRSTPQEAIEILEHFGSREAGISPTVFEYLERSKFSRRVHAVQVPGVDAGAKRESNAVNLVIGNNATAVEAAAAEARRLGYTAASESASQSEGPAEEVGRRLAETALQMHKSGPTCRRPPKEHNGGDGKCFISGGEPVVKLIDASRRGKGGRNQQLALAALERLAENGEADGIVLLSGGTDGEDGPTDAAGALVDAEVISAARQHKLEPTDYLARNDAYNFFAPLDALLRTGPTGTNVCDLRVILAYPLI